MGDIANFSIEEGENMWFAHCAGNCLEDCVYCEYEHLDDGDYVDGEL